MNPNLNVNPKTNNTGKYEMGQASNEVVGSTYIPTTEVVGPSPAMLKVANQSYLRAEYQHFVSNLKATYTRHAIDNTSMLVERVEHCLSLSPKGEDEYRSLIRAYVYSAMQEIIGGEW